MVVGNRRKTLLLKGLNIIGDAVDADTKRASDGQFALGRIDAAASISTTQYQKTLVDLNGFWREAVDVRLTDPELAREIVKAMVLDGGVQEKLIALLTTPANAANDATKYEKNEVSPVENAEAGGKYEINEKRSARDAGTRATYQKNEKSMLASDSERQSSWLPRYTAITYRDLAAITGKSKSALQEELPTANDPTGEPSIRVLGRKRYVLTAWLNANRKK